jgi:hypothetical protein
MSIQPHALLAAPAILLLEVMDKEPRLAYRALLYGVLSVVGYLLSRKRWWLGLLVLPVVGAFAWADLSELRDPFVGPAILEEAGLLHVLAWYTFMLVGIGVPVLTAAIFRRRKSL